MLFIWVVNMLGFIPLPLTGETWHHIPVWGIYAATSSLSVTVALALLTFFFTHIEGIRWNGPVRYFRSWIPEVPKAIGRWFPYVATLMLFIWVVNMLGFLPLPLTGEKWHIGGLAIPTFGIYAATASLSVTLALSAMTFVFTHVEGIRWNGPVRYFRSWIPEVPKALLPMIVPLEILSQFMRLISLSVRLYANMLAGHMLILTFVGLIIVLGNVFLAIIAVPAATLFYLFEVIIVVSIQAYIFAALSAIYIGSAIEPEH